MFTRESNEVERELEVILANANMQESGIDKRIDLTINLLTQSSKPCQAILAVCQLSDRFQIEAALAPTVFRNHSPEAEQRRHSYCLAYRDLLRRHSGHSHGVKRLLQR